MWIHESSEKYTTETDAAVNLRQIKEYVQSGWPPSVESLAPELRPYWGVHGDISIVDGLLMAGSRIIFPTLSRS